MVRPGKGRNRTVFLLEMESLREVIEVLEGNRLVRFNYDGIFEEVLDRLGRYLFALY